MKTKLLIFTSIIILILGGCRKANTKEYDANLITTINTALSNNDSDKIMDILSKKALETEVSNSDIDKLTSFIPEKIVKTTNFGKATITNVADNDNSQKKTSIIYVYHLAYTAYTEYDKHFFVTIEYTKKNSIEPEREGVNYIGIISYDSNGKRSGYEKIGNPVFK